MLSRTWHEMIEAARRPIVRMLDLSRQLGIIK